jgi:acetolactate synthase I/II/III large subunit
MVSHASPGIEVLPDRRTVSTMLVDLLRDEGFRHSFGITGGAILPIFAALRSQGLAPVHFRHEAGAVFAALECELAGGGGTVVYTTTGPGLTNALTGVAAARAEGGRIVLLSGATGHLRRRRYAFQETGPSAMPNLGLFGDNGWFDLAELIESPEQLVGLIPRLREGLRRPRGFCAHLCLPLSVQDAGLAADEPELDLELEGGFVQFPPAADAAALEACSEWLARGPVVVWVGHGARLAAGEVRALVERLGAFVMTTPRGKGIFPASDSRCLGVTGFGGHEAVFEQLAAIRPATTLVLGSRLGEFSCFWDPRYVAERVIHVDLDPQVFGASYLAGRHTLGVQAEIASFATALRARLPSVQAAPKPMVPSEKARAPELLPTPVVAELASPAGVRPSALMSAVQRQVVEGSKAMVLSEAGNAFVWATNRLRFDEPGRYRTSMGFGSMGHAASGVIGAALATGRAAVALVGDGSMLMNNEITTAVEMQVPAIWVVLNDSRLGLVDDGMQGLGYRGGLTIPAVDFVAIATAMGALGIRVDDERELDAALQQALAARAPVVIDVVIDTREPAPFGSRNRSLAQQAGAA